MKGIIGKGRNRLSFFDDDGEYVGVCFSDTPVEYDGRLKQPMAEQHYTNRRGFSIWLKEVEYDNK